MNYKKWYQSKTVWFNILTVVVTAATMLGYVPDPAVTEKATAILLMVSPIVNFALRMFTTKAISSVTE